MLSLMLLLSNRATVLGVAMVLECLSPGRLLDPAPDDLSDDEKRLRARSSIAGPATTLAADATVAAAAAARVMVTVATAVVGDTAASTDVMTSSSSWVLSTAGLGADMTAGDVAICVGVWL